MLTLSRRAALRGAMAAGCALASAPAASTPRSPS
jgi:hypothetical protein